MFLRSLSLLLPIFVPSWRFFDGIAPSPRIEVRELSGSEWVELMPRPDSVNVFNMLLRLAHNARWNEYLYLVSCAERFVEDERAHALDEILKRIRSNSGVQEFQFRLILVSRRNSGLVRETLFVSEPYVT